MSIPFTPIGFVRNHIIEKREGFTKKGERSEIEILPEFSDGLYKLNENTYIDVLFYFNRSEKYDLITRTITGEIKGVFASRSPHRPNGVGVTTVKLLEIQGAVLVVSGLDAMNNSPIIDIKPCDKSFFDEQSPTAAIQKEKLTNNPRFEIIKAIKSENYEWLLIQAAQLHGHFCPGLAMGVLAAVKAVNELNAHTDEMKDIWAITETNGCFSDGIQMVTGCTFGNKNLILKDHEKTALTLFRINDKGFRIYPKMQTSDILKEKFPDFDWRFHQIKIDKNQDDELRSRFKKVSRECSFELLQLPFEELFSMEEIETGIKP
ncbi:tRNA (N6-threonylcarbamoyladenosine(37)-N6)-methyltransferase TrmO [Geofilum rubicundum]|uniref:TsaA-like domain-containing protein n=1 Tax=Geofilum rubicundum JCM 15548 TaxID=1236989 RepID=A0A0E9M365_9BACT|nr:tRNA (N6-threonylcarbamoyladenosine(37)-N6)-methyltransferase TrmO [Geofilum rubicundum]GAO31923.1 hypothetical protein JCM15548_14336 [Geofilum rubicundum JCM 15548]